MSYYKKYDDENLENKNKQIAAINETAAKNKQTITENYNAQIADAQKAYDEQERINAVQKIVNEMQVAESMANMGLTDSGLNRTQQTAVQLSYANNKAKLDRQKQSAIDALNREMNAYLTEADTTATKNIAAVEDTYNQNRQSYAASMQQADIDAAAKVEAERIKSQQENAGKISQISYGDLANMSYASNGNVIYTDTSGNSVTMRAGANPYTGEINADLLVDGVYDASRAFSNGYQPKYYKGKELSTYKPSKSSNISSKTMVPWRNDGKEQQIFTTGDNKYYAWYGSENRYVEARYNPFTENWEFNIG